MRHRGIELVGGIQKHRCIRCIGDLQPGADVAGIKVGLGERPFLSRPVVQATMRQLNCGRFCVVFLFV